MQKSHESPQFRGAERARVIIMNKATGKAQADSKRKGKAEAKAQPTAKADKPTADSKADKPAGRAEAEAKALALVGDVKSHTGGRINLDSVRICPRKGGKVKAFLRPTYETPEGITLTPYEAGGFTGFTICDLTTEAGRQTLAALISAKRKPTAAEKKAADKASKAEASKASQQGKADKPTGKPASKGKAADSKTAGKGKADKAQASKPTAGKATQGKAGKPTA